MTKNKFISKKFKDTNININFEIYRGILYFKLLDGFIKLCVDNFNTAIFSLKKPYYRTLTNLLSGWFFYMYSKYDFSNDSFFPSNYYDKTYIISTIKDYASTDSTIVNFNDKINNILCGIDILYKHILIKIKIFNNTNYILNLNKYHYEKIINNKIIFYYKYRIEITFSNKKLTNIFKNIIIPRNTFNKMKNNYDGPNNKLDEYIWIILFRYQLLGSNNNQLSILPTIFKKIKKDFNSSNELFASAINSNLNNYCSLYYDIEKYFGSKGSFFHFIPLEGTFICNPPYQKDLIENTINRLLEFLNYSYKLSFIITIPIWDLEGKKIMEKNNMPNNNNIINYEDFFIIKKIKQSKYFKGIKMISKDDFTYYDHNFNIYKNSTIQNTYIIVLSNYNNNYIDILNKYNFKE